MPTPQELEQKFWQALKSDMTMMLGLDGVEDGHARPMTAQLEHDDRGPIWFFTARDNTIVKKLAAQSNRTIATFTSKGHDLFATIHGTIPSWRFCALIPSAPKSGLTLQAFSQASSSCSASTPR
jgi:general stress protein 26